MKIFQFLTSLLVVWGIAVPASAEKICPQGSMTIGLFGNSSAEVPYEVAHKKGWFKEAGLCVRLWHAGKLSVHGILGGLRNGELQIVSSVSLYGLCPRFKVKCTVVAVFTRHPGLVLLAHKDDKRISRAAFGGVKMAVQRCANGVPKGLGPTMVRAHFSQNRINTPLRCIGSDLPEGVTSQQVLHAVPLGGTPKRKSAFELGEVDLVMLSDIVAGPMLATGKYRIVLANKEFLLPVTSGITVRQDFLKANRDAVRAFVQVTRRAFAYLDTHPEEYVAHLAKMVGLEKKVKHPADQFGVKAFWVKTLHESMLSEIDTNAVMRQRIAEFFRFYNDNPSYQFPLNGYDPL